MTDNNHKNWRRSLFRHGGTVLSVLLIIAALGVLAAVVPVFGNRGLIVRSGSMEPSVGVGDLVIVRPNAAGYKEGDVIAFKSGGQDKVIVTHRIVGIEQTETGIILTTKGDANNQPDINKVKPEHIIGRQIFTVPYLGRLLAFGKTKGGYLAFILIPGLVVILSEIIVIVREILRGRRCAPALVVRHCEPRAKRGVWQSFEKRRLVPIDSAVSIFFPLARGTKGVLKHSLYFFAITAIMIPSTFAFYADSEISANNSFQAGCWSPPTVPVHTYPPDGTVAGAGSHWVTNPYLDWEDSTAPCGGTMHYQYQSAHNANLDPVLYSSGLLSSSQIPAPGTPDGIYFWHVRSFDGQNYSEWSNPWKLTVDRSLGQADHVVISEVQIAGVGDAEKDFIELYNPTSGSINMDDWKLVKKISGGSTGDINTINNQPIIPSHGFWLWTNNSLSALNPDEKTTAILSEHNSIQLQMPDGTPVDSVAWGSGANQFIEGSAFSTNPGAGKSLERKAVSDSNATSMSSGADASRGNGFDSDDNSFDFILREESNPQNSTTGGTETP